MTIIHFSNTANAETAIIVLTLSGESVLDNPGSGTATAGIEFSPTLAKVSKNVGGVYTQVDETTDWARPIPDASKYEIKAVVSGIGDPDPTSGPTLGSWHNLGTAREWQNTNSTLDTEVKTQLTVSIRVVDDATTEVSGTYTINATVGIPI